MYLSLLRLTYVYTHAGGDLQRLFDKLPTPGDDLVLQIPYKYIPIICMKKTMKIRDANAPTYRGQVMLTNLLQISTLCPTWGR